MKFFNKDMTFLEAQETFFDAMHGKTDFEKEEIKKEYESVLPLIIEKETKKAQEGWMC